MMVEPVGEVLGTQVPYTHIGQLLGWGSQWGQEKDRGLPESYRSVRKHYVLNQHCASPCIFISHISPGV